METERMDAVMRSRRLRARNTDPTQTLGGVGGWIKLDCEARRMPEERSSLHGGVKRRTFNEGLSPVIS